MAEQDPDHLLQISPPVAEAAGFTAIRATGEGATSEEGETDVQSPHLGGAALAETAALILSAEATVSAPPDDDDSIKSHTEQSPATQFLNDMRRRQRESNRPVAAAGILPTPYKPVLKNLRAIHQADLESDPQTPVSERAVARLLSNVVRFRSDTGIGPDDPPKLTRAFLQDLYATYAEDVKAFRQNRIVSPDLTALSHSSAIIAELQKEYAQYDFIGRSELTTSFSSNRSNPREVLDALVADIKHMKQVVEPRLRRKYGFEGEWTIAGIKAMCKSRYGGEVAAEKIFQTMQTLQAENPDATPDKIESWAKKIVIPVLRNTTNVRALLGDIPHLSLTPEDIAEGTRQLALIREAKCKGDVTTLGGRGGRAAWAPETAKLVRLAKANWQDNFGLFELSAEVNRLWATVKTYNELQPEFAINSELENLYRILVAYAQDVALLRQEAYPSAAHRVAWFYDAGVYQRYKAKYADHPLVTSAAIADIIRDSKGDVDHKIAQWLSRMRPLIERFEGAISPKRLGRLALLPDALQRAEQCVALKEKVMPNRPWVAHDDVESFFSNRNPEKDFVRWAGKVEKIRAHPSCEHLYLKQCKRLARREGTAEKILEDHAALVKTILDTYKKHSFVTPAYAARLAAESPDDYQDLAAGFIVRGYQIKHLLSVVGVRAGRTVLSRLALAADRTPEEQAKAYLERRKFLMERLSDVPDAEQWMIDQVASLDLRSPRAMRRRINALIEIKLQGAFTNSATDSAEESPQQQDEPTLDIGFRRLAELKPFLYLLAPRDQIAVITTLGFSGSAQQSELQEELGVDLEAYVFNEVIPHLLQMIQQQRS